MKLTAETNPLSLRLVEPIATARGTIFVREGLVLIVRDEAGNWGRGELMPLPGWSTATLAEAKDELARWVRSLPDAEDHPVQFHGGIPEVSAAIDAALQSLRAAQSGDPLWRWLGGTRGSISVNALAVGGSIDSVVASAQAAVDAGFGTIKVKLGMGDDTARIDALARSIDANIRIRLDANGAWSATEAERLLGHAVETLGDRLEYVEDPVATLDELFAINAGAPIAADELVRDRADLEALITSRVADSGAVAAVVMKPPLLGGITPVIEIAAELKSHDVNAVISSTYDGPVGLATWCHLAAAIGGDHAHGLGTAAIFGEGIADQVVPYRGTISF